MRFIIRKVIEAKSIKQAILKESKAKLLEVYMSEDEFKTQSVTPISKDIGYKVKKT